MNHLPAARLRQEAHGATHALLSILRAAEPSGSLEAVN